MCTMELRNQSHMKMAPHLLCISGPPRCLLYQRFLKEPEMRESPLCFPTFPEQSWCQGAALRLPAWLCRPPLLHGVWFSSFAKCVRVRHTGAREVARFSCGFFAAQWVSTGSVFFYFYCISTKEPLTVQSGHSGDRWPGFPLGTDAAWPCYLKQLAFLCVSFLDYKNRVAVHMSQSRYRPNCANAHK